MCANKSTARVKKIRVDTRALETAEKLAKDFHAASAEEGVRFALTAAAALNNARRIGFTMTLIGPMGRWYSYDLATPGIAYELNSLGMRSGKTVNLVEIAPLAKVPSSVS